MSDDGDRGNPVLRFFGLETGEKAAEVFVWALPYVAIMVSALVGLSLLVQWMWPLPWLVHVAAIVLAMVYLFLFMARVRRMTEGGDSAPEEEEEKENHGGS